MRVFKYIFVLSLAVFGMNAKAEIDTSKLIPVNSQTQSKCVEYYIVNGKSYCSTKALNAPAANINYAAYEPINIKFDDRKWKAAFGNNTNQLVMIEYIPDKDKIENWHELITAQFFPKLKVAPEKFYQLFINNLKQKGFNIKERIHAQSQNELIFEFQVLDAASAQDELQRIIVTPQGLYDLHYVIKKSDMGAEHRNKWINLLKQATVKYQSK